MLVVWLLLWTSSFSSLLKAEALLFSSVARSPRWTLKRKKDVVPNTRISRASLHAPETRGEDPQLESIAASQTSLTRKKQELSLEVIRINHALSGHLSSRSASEVGFPLVRCGLLTTSAQTHAEFVRDSSSSVALGNMRQSESLSLCMRRDRETALFRWQDPLGRLCSVGFRQKVITSSSRHTVTDRSQADFLF